METLLRISFSYPIMIFIVFTMGIDIYQIVNGNIVVLSVVYFVMKTPYVFLFINNKKRRIK